MIRPPAPLPATFARSRSCSAASRRTTGDSAFPLPAAGPAGAAVAATTLPAAGPPAGAVDAGGAVVGPTVVVPMRASGVPTGTVCPSGTRISSSTPSYGLGISESTLSVDTS